jgi:6-pyruvoyltetrahydropterin/6-carboxytetrahydropterin synthase
MFEVTVEHEFCAAHALVIGGVREPLHGHNWRTTVCVAGPELDGDGLLCDFHALERAVREATASFTNADLSGVPPFDRVGASAERVAEEIGRRVAAGLGPLARGAGVSWVRVTEAPGCAATYRASGGSWIEGARADGRARG